MKKKSTLVLLMVFVALVAGYFAFVHKWHGPDNEFQVADAKLVGKVSIEEVKENETSSSLVLERKAADDWTVNGKYPASLVQVNDFLTTLTTIRVKEPINDKAQATSLSLLKRNHIRVKIFDINGGELKDYLIGPTDSKQTANIFKMEYSDKCYMVSKPAWDGYVSIYYSTVEENWRDKAIWDVKAEDVQMVSAQYLSDTANNSFEIAKVAEGWKVNGTQMADANRVRSYLGLFQGKINAESFADSQYPGMQDSLMKRQADARLIIQTPKEKISLGLYARPEASSNFFALIEGRKELLTVQHFVIEPFLKIKGYFVQ